MEARDLRIKTEALVHACVVSEMENGGGGPLGVEVCQVRMRTGEDLSENESAVSIGTDRIAVVVSTHVSGARTCVCM